MKIKNYFCQACPFQCGVDRETQFGVCRLPNKILVSHTQQHFFEEPMISGEQRESQALPTGRQVSSASLPSAPERAGKSQARGGSGAIFFTGCNGRCVFCQNYKISQPEYWLKSKPTEMDNQKLLDICLELIEKNKVHNINFVSPTPYSALLTDFLSKHKKDIPVPIIWNSNGYEKAETIRRLSGLVDVYLPDLKYFDDMVAVRYSGFQNYFRWASQAILEMHRQVGFPDVGKDGFIRKGLIIRHLVLPGQVGDSKKILSWIRENLGTGAFVALMAQYYPAYRSSEFPEIDRRLKSEEYQKISNYFMSLGFDDGLVQELEAADATYTPNFE